MPRVIQTGETVTLSDLVVRSVHFDWPMELSDPANPASPLVERFHAFVGYDRVRADGTVFDHVIREVTPGAALLTAINTWRDNQRTASKTAEGI